MKTRGTKKHDMSCKCGYDFSRSGTSRSWWSRSFAVVSNKHYQTFLKLESKVLKARGVDAKDAGAVRALLAGSPEGAFYQNKVQAAIHFAHRGLPLVAAQAVALHAGEVSPMEAVF